jgi:hypothetical protein
MAFLSWMLSQGYALSKIAQTMVSLGDSGTLAQLYLSLTSDSSANAFPNFQAAVRALGRVTSDDPFGGASHPTSLAHVRGTRPAAVCETKSHRLMLPRKAKG